jgi:ABC-type transporter Mla MlaB component
VGGRDVCERPHRFLRADRYFQNPFLGGELDVATVQELQDKIVETMGAGQAVIMDMAQLTYLDSSAIHCLVRTWMATGHPVVLQNTTPAVRRILSLSDGEGEPEAWVFDVDGLEPPAAGRQA